MRFWTREQGTKIYVFSERGGLDESQHVAEMNV